MKRIILLLSLILFFSVDFLSAKEEFPFIAQSNIKDVDVKAGGNINFESICKLNKGEKVVVIEKKYDWFKIQLPEKAICYIHSDYVKKEGESSIAEVTANRVNLRAKPGQNYTILSQLNKGNKVRISKRVNEWYEINAPQNCFGWVHDKFLNFYSNETAPPRPKIDEILEKQKLQQQKKVLLKEQKEKYEFKATGIIRPIFCMFDCKATHKLVDINNKTICFLEADRLTLKKFVNFKVRILGIEHDQRHKIYPIVKVKKINIM